MSLIRQGGHSLAWQVGGFLAMAVSGMVTARWLGPADRGLLAATYLYLQLASSLGSLSVTGAVFHRLSLKEHTLEEFAGTLAWASGGLGVAVLGLSLAVLRAGGDSWHRGIPWNILVLALLPLPCLFALTYFSTLLRGVMDIRWYNLGNHGPKLLSLCTVLLLVAVDRLRVWELVITGTLLTMVTGAIPVWRMRRYAPGAWRFRGELFRQLVGDGLRLHVGSIAILLANRANLLLANHFLSKAEVGYLYVAITLAELVWFISIAAETVLYPQVAQMSDTDAAVLTARVCRQILCLSALAGLGLILLAPAGVLVYGGWAFLPAATPLRLLVPGVVALTISRILSALWIRKGWFRMLSVLAGSTGVLSVALNLLLIPRLGTVGATLATTIPYGLNAVASVLIYRRWISRDVAGLWRIRREDIVHLVRSLAGKRAEAPCRS
jgi:O-antigen/teichoic acid export membrane protein